MVKLSNLVFGKRGKTKQLPTMSPEQMQFFNQFLQQLGGLQGMDEQALQQLQEYMDPTSAAYQRFEDPYLREFEQQTVPGLAERFAGAGAMGGGLSSSGFGQSLSAAGANLQSQLAEMKSGLQRQAIGDIMQAYQSRAGQALGAQPFGYQYQQGSPGLLQQMAGGYAQGGFPGLSAKPLQNLYKRLGGY